MTNRIASFTYGAVAYAIFFGTFLYSIGFVGNVLVPKSMDAAPTVSLGRALLIDILLLGLFAVQHSVMARPTFKRWWTRYVPVPIERTTYTLFSSIAMIALFWLWQRAQPTRVPRNAWATESATSERSASFSPTVTM